MEIVIKIPDELYKKLKTPRTVDLTEAFDQRATLVRAIQNGTPYNPTGDCISREAVRSKIWKERVEKDEGCNSEYIRGLKTAIGFIDNAQTVEISGLPKIHYDRGFIAGYEKGKAERPQVTVFTENTDEKAIEDMKAELQSVLDNERQKGKWIECRSSDHWKCDKCGHPAPLESRDCEWLSNFCPNCGADMRKGGAE